jgi:aspartate ammonia-lyase
VIDNDRIKLLVERNVHALMAANGAVPQTKADEQFVADMIELGVGTLQAIHEIAYYLGEIASSMEGSG